MKNGRFFYQNYSEVNFINGSYALKTREYFYHTVNYAIENPFQENSQSIFKGELIKDTYFNYIGPLSVKVEEKIKEYYYFFDWKGLSIGGKYLKKCDYN